MENSFFSPCIHYQEQNWKNITGIAPQFICIIPENISNTSASEAANTFQPKLAYYKGNISGVGGWKWKGNNLSTLPFMFAVNYNPGGETDPILSYSDERIGDVTGIGLMRRFFMQRMAIMRNGQYYDTFFVLKNKDIFNINHREYISLRGQLYELYEIQGYKPTVDDSTACFLRKYVPISQEDYNAVYPSKDSVSGNPNSTDIFEIEYHPLMCLNTDIPQQ